MRIKVLDSRPAVKDLLKKLVDASDIEKATSIEWYSNPDDFLESYVSEENNLIFIKFGSLFSCLDIAKKINTIDKSARFIFYSESDQYAIDAYQFHPVDFLLEPISYDRLKDALERYYLESKTFLCSS